MITPTIYSSLVFFFSSQTWFRKSQIPNPFNQKQYVNILNEMDSILWTPLQTKFIHYSKLLPT